MNYTVKELKRQIGFAETMKKRATEKYEAKMQAYDEKIEEVKLALKELNRLQDIRENGSEEWGDHNLTTIHLEDGTVVSGIYVPDQK